MESAASTSTSLIHRAQAGDSLAWDTIVELYGPTVYRWLRQKGLQSSDARDVMQDVFRNVVRALPGFRKSRQGDSFRGWLFVITRNEMNQFFRRGQKNADAAGGSTAQAQLQHLAEDEQTWTESQSVNDKGRIVRRALEILRPDFEESTWTAFWRLAVDGHSAKEIGDDLGMTAKAVRQAKYRVLLKLRDLLNEDFGQPEN